MVSCVSFQKANWNTAISIVVEVHTLRTLYPFIAHTIILIFTLFSHTLPPPELDMLDVNCVSNRSYITTYDIIDIVLVYSNTRLIHSYI